MGQVSGDARILLSRAVYENQWSFEEFDRQVINSQPPDEISDALNPFELAVIRRAWHADFPPSGATSMEVNPWWSHAELAGEQRSRRPPSESPWPPPVGHPSWGDARDLGHLEHVSEPMHMEQPPPRLRKMGDPRVLFHHEYVPDKTPRARTGRGMSTFTCGEMHPLPATDVVPGDAASLPRARRPLSAPPGGRVPESSQPRWGASAGSGSAGFRRRARPQYKSPAAAPRCSGQSPWWQSGAWSTVPFEADTPPDRPLPKEWPAFAGPPSRCWLGPRQDWIPTPLTAAYGKRVASHHKGDGPRWRH